MLVTIPRRALKACALVVAVNLVGCGAAPEGETDSHSGAQAETLAIALGVGGSSALAAIAVPVAIGAAAGAVIAMPLILARDDYEQEMEQALRASLATWFEAGVPAEYDWYRHAMETFLPVASDVARADFAAQFVEEASPAMIARFSNPADSVFGVTGREVTLADVSELHTAVIAHIAAPNVMTSLAESALVPGFMDTDEFAAVHPQILEGFGLAQPEAFSGITQAALAKHTLAQINNLSTRLMNAAGSLTSTLQAQYAVRAQVHSAFFTQLLTVKHNLPAHVLTLMHQLLDDADAGVAALQQGVNESNAASRANELDSAARAAKRAADAMENAALEAVDRARRDTHNRREQLANDLDAMQQLADHLGVTSAAEAAARLRHGDPDAMAKAIEHLGLEGDSWGINYNTGKYDPVSSLERAQKARSDQHEWTRLAKEAETAANQIRDAFGANAGSVPSPAQQWLNALDRLLRDQSL